MRTSDKKPWDDLSKEEVEAFAAAADRTEYAELSREVGRFIVWWSQLEAGTLLLLRKMCTTPDEYDFLVLGGQLDIYERCTALVGLSWRKKRPPGWHEDLAALCKRVNGPFREERNRIVHDAWLVEGKKISRLHYKPRPAGRDVWPTAVTQKSVSIQEVQEISARLMLSVGLLKRLDQALGPEETGEGAPPAL